LTPLPKTAQPLDFPIAIVPEPFRAAVADAAERMCVPIGFIANPLMVAFGSIVGRQIGVRPKRLDHWYEVPNLWGMVVANPGMLKSPAQEEALRGLLARDKAEAERYRAECDLYAVKERIARRDIARIEKEIKRAKSGTSIDDLDRQQQKAQQVLDAAPKRRRFILNDTTHEKLAMLLQDNPNGILQQRDELSGFILQFEKKGREDGRSFYLEAWNGKNPYTVQRVGRDPVDINATCVSVFGTIQPGPALALVADASDGGSSADGLLQRFQIITIAVVPLPWTDVDRKPDAAARDRVDGIFARAERLDTKALKAEDGPLPTLRFSSDAQLIFDEWRKQLEARVRSEDDPPSFIAYLSKMRKTVPTLALLFHLTEIFETGEGGPISASALIAACAWGEVLEEHARWLYDPQFGSPMHKLAKRIERKDVVDGMSVRDLLRKKWSGLTTQESVGEALDELTVAGWLKVEEKPTGGRSSQAIRLHPDLEGNAS
jgi:hypothetical protein